MPPEYDLIAERNPRHYYKTGRYIWTVFDAATQGPIESGIAQSMSEAARIGGSRRYVIENSELYKDEREYHS